MDSGDADILWALSQLGHQRGPGPGGGRGPGRAWRGIVEETPALWCSWVVAAGRASRESIIIRLARLGWTQAEIADTVGVIRQRVSQIANIADFGNFSNLLAQGRDMAYIADLNSMDLALAWALRLDGKTDQERFSKEELNWGLRTWDMWNFNDCDSRFGDDWPGRIPAQLVAHTLFYFTNQGDLVFDPMAGGGVVPVTAWHVMMLIRIGFELVEWWLVPCPGMRNGANRDARVAHENVILLRRW